MTDPEKGEIARIVVRELAIASLRWSLLGYVLWLCGLPVGAAVLAVSVDVVVVHLLAWAARA